MARGDLFDFGDPTDPQRRGLDGQFVGGPKPGGVLDVPCGGGLLDGPAQRRPTGVETWGSGVDTWGVGIDSPRKPSVSGVEAWGSALDQRKAASPRSDLRSGWVVLLVAAVLVVAAVFVWANRSGGDAGTDVPSAPPTSHVYPGAEGRFVMPGSQG